jgi:hypothetical protein
LFLNLEKFNLESTVKFSADDCLMYRKIMSDGDIETLQIGLERLGKWVLEYQTWGVGGRVHDEHKSR